MAQRAPKMPSSTKPSQETLIEAESTQNVVKEKPAREKPATSVIIVSNRGAYETARQNRAASISRPKRKNVVVKEKRAKEKPATRVIIVNDRGAYETAAQNRSASISRPSRKKSIASSLPTTSANVIVNDRGAYESAAPNRSMSISRRSRKKSLASPLPTAANVIVSGRGAVEIAAPNRGYSVSRPSKKQKSDVSPLPNAAPSSPHSLNTTASSSTRPRRTDMSATLTYVMQPAMYVHTQPIAEENDAFDDIRSGLHDDLPLGADASSLSLRNKTAPVIDSAESNIAFLKPHNSRQLLLPSTSNNSSSVVRHSTASARANAKYLAKEGWRGVLPANISNAIAFERKRSEIHDHVVAVAQQHSAISNAASRASVHSLQHHRPASPTGSSMIASYMNESPGAVPAADVSEMMKTVLAAATASPLPSLRPWRENLVLLAGFMSMIMIEPIATSSGIFLTPLANSLHVTYGEVSFALGLQSGGIYLIAPLTNILNERFGFKLCAIISTMISILGFAGTAYFAQSIWHFYIGYGFISGLSLGVTLMSIIGGLGFIFPGKDGKVTFVITGIAVGNMVMPPLLDAIINKWRVVDIEGWRAGLYILAALQILLLFLCMVFKVPGERCCRGPSQLTTHGIKSGIIPMAIRNKRWLILGISYFFWNTHRLFQLFAPHIVAVYYSQRYNSGIIITVFGVSELFGRVLTIVLNSRPQVARSWRYVIMSLCLLVKSACLCFAALLLEFIDDGSVPFEIFCIPIGAAGFLAGIVWNTYPWYILSEFGPFHFAQASDWMEVFAGIAALMSVVIAGQLTQLGTATPTGKKNVYLVAPFYMAAAGVCGAWLSFLMFTIVSRRHLKTLAIVAGSKVHEVEYSPPDTATLAPPTITIKKSSKLLKNDDSNALLISSVAVEPIQKDNKTSQRKKSIKIAPSRPDSAKSVASSSKTAAVIKFASPPVTATATVQPKQQEQIVSSNTVATVADNAVPTEVDKRSRKSSRQSSLKSRASSSAAPSSSFVDALAPQPSSMQNISRDSTPPAPPADAEMDEVANTSIVKTPVRRTPSLRSLFRSSKPSLPQVAEQPPPPPPQLEEPAKVAADILPVKKVLRKPPPVRVIEPTAPVTLVRERDRTLSPLPPDTRKAQPPPPSNANVKLSQRLNVPSTSPQPTKSFVVIRPEITEATSASTPQRQPPTTSRRGGYERRHPPRRVPRRDVPRPVQSNRVPSASPSRTMTAAEAAPSQQPVNMQPKDSVERIARAVERWKEERRERSRRVRRVLVKPPIDADTTKEVDRRWR